MCLPILVGVSLCSCFVSTAVILPPSNIPNNALHISQTLPSLVIPNNVTNTTFPPSNVLRFQCDGTEYGRNLNPSSCRDIFHYIKQSDDQTTFSQRHTGRPNDLPLPLRFLSNDALCFVQPLLQDGAITAHASPTELARAAYTLFQRCVVSKGMGGIAANIGGDNNLNVVIADYTPNIRCDRTATPGPPWQSCLLIVSDMAATRDRKVFGVKSQDPRVEVNLPHVFKAIDARCQVTVGITGKSTSASWYEIWEAVSALAAKCIRAHDKGGKAFGMGLRKNIFVHITDENADQSPPAGNTGNVSALAPLLGIEASNNLSQGGEPELIPDPFIELSSGLVRSNSSLSTISDSTISDKSEDPSA